MSGGGFVAAGPEASDSTAVDARGARGARGALGALGALGARGVTMGGLAAFPLVAAGAGIEAVWGVVFAVVDVVVGLVVEALVVRRVGSVPYP